MRKQAWRVVNAATILLALRLASALGDVDSTTAPSTAPTSGPTSMPTTQAVSGPNPTLTPADVVRTVVEALRSNDQADAGIRLTWAFASPGNKQITGPVDRFIPMVKTPAYLPLLNDRQPFYHPPEIHGDQAQELVKVTEYSGEQIWYIFMLSRQTGGALDGCWMTDGVTPVQPGRRPMPSGPPV